MHATSRASMPNLSAVWPTRVIWAASSFPPHIQCSVSYVRCVSGGPFGTAHCAHAAAQNTARTRRVAWSCQLQLKTDHHNTLPPLAQRFVSRHSKHCRECGHCTAGFDHHCMWVNACVGRANYRAFLVLLCSLVLLLATQLGLSIWLAHGCLFVPGDAVAARLTAAFGAGGASHRAAAAAAGMLIGSAAAAAAPLYGLADLLLLHAVLAARGISTFEYIMANRCRAECAGVPAAMCAGRRPVACACRCCSTPRPQSALLCAGRIPAWRYRPPQGHSRGAIAAVPRCGALRAAAARALLATQRTRAR